MVRMPTGLGQRPAGLARLHTPAHCLSCSRHTDVAHDAGSGRSPVCVVATRKRRCARRPRVIPQTEQLGEDRDYWQNSYLPSFFFLYSSYSFFNSGSVGVE